MRAGGLLVLNGGEHLLPLQSVKHEDIGFLNATSFMLNEVLNVNTLLSVLFDLELRSLGRVRVTS